jgi:hypothetical protein
MAFMARGQQLRNRDPADPVPELSDIRYGLVDLGLPTLCLRHNPSDRPAVASDDDSFAALHLVEKLRQMGLRF